MKKLTEQPETILINNKVRKKIVIVNKVDVSNYIVNALHLELTVTDVIFNFYK